MFEFCLKMFQFCLYYLSLLRVFTTCLYYRVLSQDVWVLSQNAPTPFSCVYVLISLPRQERDCRCSGCSGCRAWGASHELGFSTHVGWFFRDQVRSQRIACWWYPSLLLAVTTGIEFCVRWLCVLHVFTTGTHGDRFELGQTNLVKLRTLTKRQKEACMRCVWYWSLLLVFTTCLYYRYLLPIFTTDIYCRGLWVTTFASRWRGNTLEGTEVKDGGKGWVCLVYLLHGHSRMCSLTIECVHVEPNVWVSEPGTHTTYTIQQ